MISPLILTVRKPTRSVTASPAERTIAEYSRGDSALQGSTLPTPNGERPRGSGTPSDGELRNLYANRKGGGRAASSGSISRFRRLPRGPQPDIIDRSGGATQQGDVAEDSRQPPLILVLEVAA